MGVARWAARSGSVGKVTVRIDAAGALVPEGGLELLDIFGAEASGSSGGVAAVRCCRASSIRAGVFAVRDSAGVAVGAASIVGLWAGLRNLRRL